MAANFHRTAYIVFDYSNAQPVVGYLLSIKIELSRKFEDKYRCWYTDPLSINRTIYQMPHDVWLAGFACFQKYIALKFIFNLFRFYLLHSKRIETRNIWLLVFVSWCFWTVVRSLCSIELQILISPHIWWKWWKHIHSRTLWILTKDQWASSVQAQMTCDVWSNSQEMVKMMLCFVRCTSERLQKHWHRHQNRRWIRVDYSANCARLFILFKEPSYIFPPASSCLPYANTFVGVRASHIHMDLFNDQQINMNNAETGDYLLTICIHH